MTFVKLRSRVCFGCHSKALETYCHAHRGALSCGVATINRLTIILRESTLKSLLLQTARTMAVNVTGGCKGKQLVSLSITPMMIPKLAPIANICNEMSGPTVIQ